MQKTNLKISVMVMYDLEQCFKLFVNDCSCWTREEPVRGLLIKKNVPINTESIVFISLVNNNGKLSSY